MTSKPRKTGYMRGKLTEKFVRSVKDAGRYHDGMGMGLMLNVEASGSQQWVQRTSFERQRIEIGLGSPPVVSLQEAREKAIDNKRQIYNGQSPLAQKAAAAGVPTFEEAANEAVASLAIGKAEKYGVRFTGALGHVLPHIGRKKVNAIVPGDLNPIFEKLIIEKPGMAKKVKDNTRAVLNWCIAKGFINSNPLDQALVSLPRIQASGKHRVALAFPEVNGFLKALHDCGASPFTKLGINFLIHTAARSGEVRGATWDEVNLEARLWTIPAPRMKAKRPHIVPLSDTAVELLVASREAQGERKASRLIFPSPTGKILSDMTFSKLVKVSLEYPVDIHGFRTSFRTWAQEKTAFSEEACELALAHMIGTAVRQAYARSDLLDERALLMQAWADYLKIPSDHHRRIDQYSPKVSGVTTLI